MTLYRPIIKESWRIMFRNKYLWFFGLFAVLLGNGGEYEIFFRSLSSNQDQSAWTIFLNYSQVILDNLTNMGQRFWENPSLTLVILLTYFFVVLIFIFIIWMMNVSQIAIVDAVFKQAKSKDSNLSIGMQIGNKYFWPVFSLNFSLKILILTVLSLLFIFRSSVVYVWLFLLMIPILMALSFLVKYAIVYMVARGEKLLKSLVLAWRLFIKNWLVSLELALILYLFTMLAGILFMFVTFNIEKFFDVLLFWLNNSNPSLSFFLFYSFMPFILFVVLAFIGALLAVFQISAWTKLFIKLDNEGARSKIERIFSK